MATLMLCRHGSQSFCLWTRLVTTGLLLLLAGSTGVADEAGVWRYGIARTKITPQTHFWMAGFAARTKPAEGTLDELWAKALALEDPKGITCLLVTADLLGVPKWLYDELCAELAKRHGLSRANVLFAPSHTHSGPVLRDALQDIYPLDDQQKTVIAQYSDRLKSALLEMINAAMASRCPCRIYAGEGQATFAVNRRTNDESKLKDMLAKGERPKGPSDFSVPVLAVKSTDGQLRAVVFLYAAHTSALTDNYLWSGDYAGVAQRAIEQSHQGAMAMFVQGCGSDQSAAPRSTVELCSRMGAELAASVETVLNKPMASVEGNLKTAFEFVTLDYGAQPSLAELEELAKTTGYRARWASRLASELKSGKRFPSAYSEYPVQVWRLGADLLWIALGGEVCVDYALRFKNEFGARTWVIGYANDVMAYIPSRRIWEEGGYQAGAFEVYGLPATQWCSDIEDRITRTVSRLVSVVRKDD